MLRTVCYQKELIAQIRESGAEANHQTETKQIRKTQTLQN